MGASAAGAAAPAARRRGSGARVALLLAVQSSGALGLAPRDHLSHRHLTTLPSGALAAADSSVGVTAVPMVDVAQSRNHALPGLPKAAIDRSAKKGRVPRDADVLLIVGADADLGAHVAAELVEAGAGRVDVRVVAPSAEDCRRNPAARALHTELLGETQPKLADQLGFHGAPLGFDDGDAADARLTFPSCLSIPELGAVVPEYGAVVLALSDAPDAIGEDEHYAQLRRSLVDELEGTLAEAGFNTMASAAWLQPEPRPGHDLRLSTRSSAETKAEQNLGAVTII